MGRKEKEEKDTSTRRTTTPKQMSRGNYMQGTDSSEVITGYVASDKSMASRTEGSSEAPMLSIVFSSVSRSIMPSV